MQSIVDEALEKTATEGHKVSHVLVYDHTLAAKREDVPFQPGRDMWWQDMVPSQTSECDVEWLDAEAPLFKVPRCHHSVTTPRCLSHTWRA